MFPQVCLHCDQSLIPGARWLCHTCLEQLRCIEIDERCPHCFSLLRDPGYISCRACHDERLPFEYVGAIFPNEGPILSLKRALFLPYKETVSRLIAAMIVRQIALSDWPMPDAITLLPPMWKERHKKRDGARIIARALSSILHIPFLKTPKMGRDYRLILVITDELSRKACRQHMLLPLGAERFLLGITEKLP